MIVGCLIFLTPAIAILLTALQPESSIAQRGPAAVPNQLTLSNFSSAWSTGELGHYYINSLLITLCRVPLAILVSSLAAYPLAKIRFRGRKVLLVLLVVGLGVPQVILLYPLLQITRHLPLNSTVWVLLLPYVATGIPFEILVMRGAFMGVSREYLEAARIDGARERYVLGPHLYPDGQAGNFCSGIAGLRMDLERVRNSVRAAEQPILSNPTGRDLKPGGAVLHELRSAGCRGGALHDPHGVVLLCGSEIFDQGHRRGGVKG